MADEAGVAVGRLPLLLGHELLHHPRPCVQLGQPVHRREGAVQQLLILLLRVLVARGLQVVSEFSIVRGIIGLWLRDMSSSSSQSVMLQLLRRSTLGTHAQHHF